MISAKFSPLKYYTLSSQLHRLASFSVGCSGRRILSPGQINTMRKCLYLCKCSLLSPASTVMNLYRIQPRMRSSSSHQRKSHASTQTMIPLQILTPSFQSRSYYLCASLQYDFNPRTPHLLPIGEFTGAQIILLQKMTPSFQLQSYYLCVSLQDDFKPKLLTPTQWRYHLVFKTIRLQKLNPSHLPQSYYLYVSLQNDFNPKTSNPLHSGNFTSSQTIPLQKS